MRSYMQVSQHTARCSLKKFSQASLLHCNPAEDLHTATAISPIYSFSGNCTASAPISTFMCLWAIYIFPGMVHIFPPAEKADPSWKYIIRSQTHECGNWDWGHDIPFLGIFVSNFQHFVFAVHIASKKAYTVYRALGRGQSLFNSRKVCAAQL